MKSLCATLGNAWLSHGSRTALILLTTAKSSKVSFPCQKAGVYNQTLQNKGSCQANPSSWARLINDTEVFAAEMRNLQRRQPWRKGSVGLIGRGISSPSECQTVACWGWGCLGDHLWLFKSWLLFRKRNVFLTPTLYICRSLAAVQWPLQVLEAAPGVCIKGNGEQILWKISRGLQI